MASSSQAPVRLAGDEATDLSFLFSQLVRLETELWNAAETRLRHDHGLTLGRFEVMQVISRRSECRVHDIAADLSITAGGTSKIVDRIEAAGHCTRRANPGDRRSSVIELTPAGKRLLAEATATFDDELRRRVGHALPERSLQQLTRTLTRLRCAVRTTGETEKTALPGPGTGSAVPDYATWLPSARMISRIVAAISSRACRI